MPEKIRAHPVDVPSIGGSLVAEETAVVFKPFVGITLAGHIFILLGGGFCSGKLLRLFIQSDLQNLFAAAAEALLCC